MHLSLGYFVRLYKVHELVALSLGGHFFHPTIDLTWHPVPVAVVLGHFQAQSLWCAPVLNHMCRNCVARLGHHPLVLRIFVTHFWKKDSDYVLQDVLNSSQCIIDHRASGACGPHPPQQPSPLTTGIEGRCKRLVLGAPQTQSLLTVLIDNIKNKENKNKKRYMRWTFETLGVNLWKEV